MRVGLGRGGDEEGGEEWDELKLWGVGSWLYRDQLPTIKFIWYDQASGYLILANFKQLFDPLSQKPLNKKDFKYIFVIRPLQFQPLTLLYWSFFFKSKSNIETSLLFSVGLYHIPAFKKVISEWSLCSLNTKLWEKWTSNSCIPIRVLTQKKIPLALWKAIWRNSIVPKQFLIVIY